MARHVRLAIVILAIGIGAHAIAKVDAAQSPASKTVVEMPIQAH